MIHSAGRIATIRRRPFTGLVAGLTKAIAWTIARVACTNHYDPAMRPHLPAGESGSGARLPGRNHHLTEEPIASSSHSRIGRHANP